MVFGIFKRNKTFVVQVPRKGGAVVLGKIEAKDFDDARNTLMNMLDEFKGNLAVKKAKYIHLVDIDGGRYKVHNPLFDPSLVESEKKTKEADLEKLTALEIIDTYSNALKTTLPKIINSTLTIPTEMMKKIAEEYATAKIGNNYAGQVGNLFQGLANFIGAIIMLSKNKDQVIELVKGLKEQGIDLREFIMSGFVGGQVGGEVEERGEQGESA